MGNAKNYWPILANTKYWPIILTVGLFSPTLIIQLSSFRSLKNSAKKKPAAIKNNARPYAYNSPST